jgi:hypothetical protein
VLSLGDAAMHPFLRCTTALAVLIAVVDGLTFMASSYDFDHASITEVFHFNTSSMNLTVDFNPYDTWDMVGASVRAPWEYVVLIGDGDVMEVQVLFVHNKTTSALTPIMNGQDAVSVYAFHCTRHRCMGINIDTHHVIAVDPLTAAVTPLYVLQFFLCICVLN